MTVLTIELIQENPWHVIMRPLPQQPTPLLLNVAHLAANYCCASEHLILKAVRDGTYKPPRWSTGDGLDDIKECEERRYGAFRTAVKIGELLF